MNVIHRMLTDEVRNKYTRSGEHMLTTPVSVIAQRQRETFAYAHTPVRAHPHSSWSGASSFRVVCQLCFEAQSYDYAVTAPFFSIQS